MGEEKEADSPQPPSKLPRLSGADPNAGMCLCKRVLFFFLSEHVIVFVCKSC